MASIERDIKVVARSVIQGNEKRKKRIKTSHASAFDLLAAQAIEDALERTWPNVEAKQIRKKMQNKLYKSIVYSEPYEHLVDNDLLCGRRQFYEARMEFIVDVASRLDMLPEE